MTRTASFGEIRPLIGGGAKILAPVRKLRADFGVSPGRPPTLVSHAFFFSRRACRGPREWVQSDGAGSAADLLTD